MAEKLAAILNRLLAACEDAYAGYRVAAHGVRDMALKKLLGGYARRRKLFAEALADQVRRLGAEPARHGTVPGALHRGWIQLREELGRATPGEILAECCRGEAHTIRLYREALQRDLPPVPRRLLAVQLERITAAAERLESLRRSPG